MRHLKIIPYSILTAGALALAGCASDTPDTPPVEMPEDSPLWLTLSLDQLSGTGEASATRAGSAGNTLSKQPWESHISSLVAILVDNEGTDQGQIKGIAKAKTITENATDQTYTALVNMGLSTLYTREHEYALYVFANLSDTEYSSLVTSSTYNQAISTIGQRTVAMDFTPAGDADNNLDLKMASNTDDVEKIIVWLKKNSDGTAKEYPEDAPYVVQTNPAGKTSVDGQAPGTIILTPLHARLDFINHSSLTFEMTESYEDASGNSQSHSEYAVEIKSAKICNAADAAYLLPQTGATGYTWKSPAVTTAKSSSAISLTAGAEMTLGYVAENIPNTTSVTYNNSTYIEIYGILKAGTDASDATKALFTDASHPALWYYDDGTFQSALTTETHTDSGESGKGWHKISYDSSLGGYKVTYRHAIRHDAGEGKNKDDGTVYPMEYAIVRNYIYQIGIASVASLPHPFSTSDPVESGKQDISLKIGIKNWTYHRGGQEISFY